MPFPGLSDTNSVICNLRVNLCLESGLSVFAGAGGIQCGIDVCCVFQVASPLGLALDGGIRIRPARCVRACVVIGEPHVADLRKESID